MAGPPEFVTLPPRVAVVVVIDAEVGIVTVGAREMAVVDVPEVAIVQERGVGYVSVDAL